MSVGVETDDTERALTNWRSIGTLAGDVLAKSARTAARREARELNGSGPSVEGTNEPPGPPTVTGAPMHAGEE